MLKASVGFGGFKIDFPTDDILELSLSRKAGEHSRFFIRGIATKEAAARVLEEFDGSQRVTLSLRDGESMKPRFTGVVTGCAAKHRGDVHELSAEAVGLSLLLDTKKNRRSFQNAEMTHEQLAKAVISSYEDADLILTGEDRAIGDMFVQYEETDWEFLKRVAGNISLKLIPADEHKGIRFYVGLPEKGKPAGIDEDRLEIRKNIGSFLRESKNDLAEREPRGALLYTLHSDRWFDTGDPVVIGGNTLYVSAAESSLEGSLFLHTYILCDDNGYLEPKRKNGNLAGTSLPGHVTDIRKDRIAVLLDIDKGNEHCGSRLFSYATLYSSPDGSGWYFMPEKGDRVMLCLPSAAEKDAYVKNAVDLPPGNPARRVDPDGKEIYTKHGKEIRMTPNSVEIRSGNGFGIGLYDTGGVEIRSAKNISLTADGDISVSGSGIRVNGNEIKMTQGSGTLTMTEDNFAADGQEVKVGE
jgi:hypothetical protein